MGVSVQTVDAAVEHHTDRIADMVFKLAVNQEKQTLDKTTEYYDDDNLEKMAIQNVSKQHGSL